jgi:predicted DNA-binding transcriptional regulator AlpA
MIRSCPEIAQTGENMTKKIIRTNSVCSAFEVCRETLRTRIKDGVWLEPISGGGWLQSEVNAVIEARAAGWGDDKIRQLVAALTAERQTAAADLYRYLQSASTVAA